MDTSGGGPGTETGDPYGQRRYGRLIVVFVLDLGLVTTGPSRAHLRAGQTVDGRDVAREDAL